MGNVIPQVAIAVGLAVLARYWNPIETVAPNAQSGLTVFGILCTFLMVFKTQTSYAQYWRAIGDTEGILGVTRMIAMSACTLLPWSPPPGRKAPHPEIAEKYPVRF